MKSVNVLATAALLAGSLAIPQQASAAERILFNCFFPPQHFVCRQVLPEMRRRIEKATEKRVRIQIPPKSLARPRDLYDGVAKGVMDGAVQYNGFIANMAPGIQFGHLPFVGNEESELTSVALWQTYQKFFGDKNEFGEAVLLSVWALNGAEIYSLTDKPIETLADIKSRKMWAIPGTPANLMKKAGASVVAGPAVQMLEIISKGVVDGFAGVPINAVRTYKITSYTKSATIFDRKIFQPTFSFYVAKRKWNKIEKKDQAAIRAVLGADFARYAGKIADRHQAAGKKDAIKNGIKFVNGSAATLKDLQRLGNPVIEGWLKKVSAMGVDGKAVLAFYRKAYEDEKAKAKK